MSGRSRAMHGLASAQLALAEDPDLDPLALAQILVDAAGSVGTVLDEVENDRALRATRNAIRDAARRDGATAAGLARLRAKLETTAARRQEQLAALAAAERLAAGNAREARANARGLDDETGGASTWVSATVAAQATNLTPGHVRRLVRQGRINARRDSEGIKVDGVELYAYASRRNRGNRL